MGLAAIEETTKIIEREIKNIKKDNDIKESLAKIKRHKKLLEDTVQLCEKFVKDVRKFLDEGKEGDYINNKERLTNMIKGMTQIAEILRTYANYLKSSIDSDLLSGAFTSLTMRMQTLADELDDLEDNMDLLVRFHNKEEGNDLQVAYDRLDDKDDSFITIEEVELLFVSPIKESINVEATYIMGEKIRPLPVDDELVYFDE